MPQGRLAGDHTPEFKHVDDMEWEMGRFNNKTKFHELLVLFDTGNGKGRMARCYSRLIHDATIIE